MQPLRKAHRVPQALALITVHHALESSPCFLSPRPSYSQGFLNPLKGRLHTISPLFLSSEVPGNATFAVSSPVASGGRGWARVVWERMEGGKEHGKSGKRHHSFPEDPGVFSQSTSSTDLLEAQACDVGEEEGNNHPQRPWMPGRMPIQLEHIISFSEKSCGADTCSVKTEFQGKTGLPIGNLRFICNNRIIFCSRCYQCPHGPPWWFPTC